MKIPPTFKFKGNTELAGKYRSKALSLYDFYTDAAEKGGIDFFHKVFNFWDGTSVELTSSKENNYLHRVGDITIKSPFITPPTIDSFLYMETGFAQYNFTNQPPVYNYTRPSKIWYNDYITGYMATDRNKLQNTLNVDTLVGSATPSGFISLASGCKKLTNTLITDSGPFISDIEEFCDLTEDTRLNYKNIQNKIKPSNFSGKLRLYVQALYGSVSGSYSMIELPTRDMLFVDEVELPYGEYHSGSCGLFTKAPGEYYLLIIKNGFIEIRELERSSISDKLVSTLVNDKNLGKEKYTQIEAYILSTCKISKKHITIPIALNESIVGEPLAYGWNFNWEGNKASIILHTDDIDSGWIYAREYELTIGYNELSKEFYTILDFDNAAQPWSAVSKIKVFVSNKFLGASIARINPVKVGGYSPAISGRSEYSASIYCFYDSEDKLVKAKVNEKFTEFQNTGVVTVNNVFRGNGVLTTEAEYDIGHELLVSCGDVVLSERAEGKTFFRESGLYQEAGGTSVDIGGGIIRNSNIKQYTILRYYLSDTVNASVFIPLNDCSSVILCNRTLEQFSPLSRDIKTIYVYPTGNTDDGNPGSPSWRLFNQAGNPVAIETPYPTEPIGTIKIFYVSNNSSSGINLSTRVVDPNHPADAFFTYNSIADPTTHIMTYSKNSIVSKGYDISVTDIDTSSITQYPFDTSTGWA